MDNKFLEILFTPSVKTAQEHYGSRRSYSRLDGDRGELAGMSEFEKEFISLRDGFYLASVSESGFPYIQFRGGPTGFLKVLDNKTVGFADFRGNMQLISTGNISENNKVALFLMDYPNRQRLKILARAEIKDAADAPELMEKLVVSGYNAKPERAMTLHVEAFDWNCPQHIPQRFTVEEIRQINQPLYTHIEKLEKEIEELREKIKN